MAEQIGDLIHKILSGAISNKEAKKEVRKNNFKIKKGE